jgi:hypothetical protein
VSWVIDETCHLVICRLWAIHMKVHIVMLALVEGMLQNHFLHLLLQRLLRGFVVRLDCQFKSAKQVPERAKHRQRDCYST